jgi:hypothetical protein
MQAHASVNTCYSEPEYETPHKGSHPSACEVVACESPLSAGLAPAAQVPAAFVPVAGRETRTSAANDSAVPGGSLGFSYQAGLPSSLAVFTGLPCSLPQVEA